MKKRVLIIEDDKKICRLEQDYLEANGIETDTAFDGQTGLEKAKREKYNLIILDIMLPVMNGLDVCKEIRKESDLPIILVSAKKEDFDKIKGLGFGADDYVVKPFSPSELVARVIAHIARFERLTSKQGSQDEEKEEFIEIDNLKIDVKARRVFVNDGEIIFTVKEFDLLYYLAKNPDTVYTKDELFDEIWRYDSIGETSTITVHVNRIRDKLKEADKNSEYIHTVWGRGYRFR